MIARKCITLAGFISTISLGAHASGFNIETGRVTASSTGIDQTAQILGIGTYSAASTSSGPYAGGTALNNSSVSASLNSRLISITASSVGGAGLHDGGELIFGGSSGVLDFSLSSATNLLISFNGSDNASATISGGSGFNLYCDWSVLSDCNTAMQLSAGSYEISFYSQDFLMMGGRWDSNIKFMLTTQDVEAIQAVPLAGAAWFFGAALFSITGAVRPRQR